MQFSCEKKAFQAALAIVARAAKPNNPLPVLQCVLVHAYDNTIRLSATDLDLGISATLPATVLESGRACINAKLLTEAVGRMTEGPMTAAVSDGQAKIKCGRAKYQLGALDGNEFPTLRSHSDGFDFSMPQSEFKDALDKVCFCASKDDNRAVFTGVQFRSIGCELVLSATDGLRMVRCGTTLTDGPDTFAAIVPAASCRSLAALLGKTGDVALSISEGDLSASVGDVSLSCRLIEGSFPDVDKMIPKSYVRTCRVGRLQLSDSIKRVLVVTESLKLDAEGKVKNSPHLFTMDINEGCITLAAHTPGVGVCTDEIGAILEGKPIKIAFNGAIMLDALAAMGGEETLIQLQENDGPACIVPFCGDDSFFFVIMPVRLSMADGGEVAVKAAA